MTWSAAFIGIVGVLYTGTVVSFLIEGKPWDALIFTGYVIGQVGFFIKSLSHA